MWEPKSRFFDGSILQEHCAEVLGLGPCGCGGCQDPACFQGMHTASEYELLIETYATLGGDGGLTERTLRLACGLASKGER